ncbi:DUF4282 domain-containing protein [Buttiauxella agrestis]|uniref:DUF4282 domain-containing protein n=1 Tax=Buttiauxella agrestis TaxID=82977 RepID=UPI0039750EE6
MKNIFFFDRLFTPSFLVFIYWICLISVVISSITTMFVGNFLAGVLGLIGGLLVTRITFELLMIAFKNNEYLRRIAEQHTPKPESEQ